jgi:hypothetical protein
LADNLIDLPSPTAALEDDPDELASVAASASDFHADERAIERTVMTGKMAVHVGNSRTMVYLFRKVK